MNQDRFSALCNRHELVGASLAILHDGSVSTAVYGKLNRDTGIAITPDSAFQIGSIGKAFTATLIMQLVDKGHVDLDRPVQGYVPEFMLADRAASERITVRQLMCHSAGFDGDFFPPDSAYAGGTIHYLAQCSVLPQIHDIGERFSYNNAAYVALGRLAERVLGLPWPEAVIERVCRPLGLKQAFADPRDAIRFRTAMGHLQSGRLAPAPYMPLSGAAAGTVLSMSATDVLQFAAAHLNRDNSPLLSSAAIEAMQGTQIDMPQPAIKGATHWGLGWMLNRTPHGLVVGHDGSTMGQYAVVRFVPDRQFAFALLTNSPSTAFQEEVERDLLRAGANIHLSPPEETDAVPPNLEALCGRYANHATLAVEISPGPNGLEWASFPRTGQEVPASERGELRPLAGGGFLAVPHGKGPSLPAQFIGGDGDPARFLSWRLRLLPRLA